MVDPSLLGIQVPSSSTQVVPQPLPNLREADAAKFQDLLSGIGGETVGSASMRDVPPLQRTDAVTESQQNSLQDALIEKVTGMDQSYRSIMEQLRDRPNLSDYMSTIESIDQSNLRSYPNVGSPDSNVERLEQMVEKMRKDNVVMIDYQNDMTKWTMNFQMWSSGVELASSIVSQLSRGFQTLFRASG